MIMIRISDSKNVLVRHERFHHLLYFICRFRADFFFNNILIHLTQFIAYLTRWQILVSWDNKTRPSESVSKEEIAEGQSENWEIFFW